MFGGVGFHFRAQAVERCADSRRLVDADLLVDGKMQREMEEGIHLPAFGRPFLFQRSGAVGEQGVIFGMTRGDVGGGDFGADQRQPFLVFLPGSAEKLANLIAGGTKHGRFRKAG